MTGETENPASWGQARPPGGPRLTCTETEALPGLHGPRAFARAAARQAAARALDAGKRVPLCITKLVSGWRPQPGAQLPASPLPPTPTLQERLPGLRLQPRVFSFRAAEAGAGAGAGAGDGDGAGAGQAGEAQGPPGQDPLQRVLQAVEWGGRGGCPWASDKRPFRGSA